MTSAALLLLTLLAQAAASEPAAPPGRPVFGWVIDDVRQPVLGARLEVFAEASGLKPLAAVVSGQFGRFQIPALAPGSYTVRVQAEGFSTLHERIVVSKGTEPFDLGRLRLDPKATLEGRVTAEGTEPLAGAQVWLSARGSGGGQRARLRATTDGDGVFRIADLDGSVPVSLEVCRKGFQTASVTVPNPAVTVKVSLARGASIEGRVVDAQRQPIPGAQLAVQPASLPCGVRLGTTTSDGEGRFVFDSLLEQTYDLHARAEGYLAAVQERVPARRGERATWLEIVLKRGVLVGGTVVSDSGGPISGATVEALGEHSRPKAASDAEGRFVLRNVEPELQVFRVTHPDYRPTETALRVRDEGSTFKFVLTRIARLKVSGTVVGPDGTAVAKARVQLEKKVLATTDAEGRFAFVTDNGTYELTAFKPGFAPGSTRPPVVVEGRAVSGIEIRLGKSAAVTGRLLGLPAGARARVTAASPPLTVQGTVGRDAVYRIADLGVGEWEVTATSGDRTAKGTVRLAKDDAEKTLDLTFTPRSEVSGWVLGPSGEPVSGADVRFFTSASDGEGVSAKSGRDGSFRVELEPGRYGAVCQRPGWSPAATGCGSGARTTRKRSSTSGR